MKNLTLRRRFWLVLIPSLTITDNALLPTCEAEALATRLGDDPQYVSVSNNLDGGTCN